MFSDFDNDQISLLDIKKDFHQHFNLKVSRTAIHKKFNSNTVQFLKELLYHHLSVHLQENYTSKDQLESFNRINIKDSTKFTLPSSLVDAYPGYGGFNRSSGIMNIQYEYDLKSGTWLCCELTKATRNDQQDSKESIESIHKGDLMIRDLGYITINYMKGVIGKEAYFLNRLPTSINVYQKTNSGNYHEVKWDNIFQSAHDFNNKPIEMNVFLGKNEKLPVRLVVEKIPDHIYEQRMRKGTKSAKSKKCTVSKEHKVRCRYNLYITNAPQEKISTQMIKDIYKLRWQIEIIFKTWKSVFSIHKIKQLKKERFESQLLAKMLWVIFNWKFLQIGNRFIQNQQPDNGCSFIKFFKQIKTCSFELRLILIGSLQLKKWLMTKFIKILSDSIIEVKKGKESLYQRFYRVKCCLS
jgi:Transposase DDE domain